MAIARHIAFTHLSGEYFFDEDGPISRTKHPYKRNLMEDQGTTKQFTVRRASF
jgi:hypothetical protein